MTLNMNGHSLRNTNATGDSTIRLEGYGARLINGTLKGMGISQPAIVCRSEHAEISDISTDGTYGCGLYLTTYSNEASVVKVRNFSITQADSETSAHAIYIGGGAHAYLENVTARGGKYGGAPLCINSRGKVSFISGSITSQREVGDTGKGLLLVHEGVTAADRLGDHLYSGCTAKVDGTSVSASTYLDFISGNNPYSRLLGWTLSVTSGINSSAPVIAAQPSNASVNEGEWAGFSLTAVGRNLTYEWQVLETNTDHGVPIDQWVAFSYNVVKNGMNTDALGFSTKPGMNGMKLRCVISNSYGTVYSNTVTLTLLDVQPTIKTQPANQTVLEGETASFSAEIWGGHLTYQWYCRPGSSGEWTACTETGYDKRVLRVPATPSRTGYQYRLTAPTVSAP